MHHWISEAVRPTWPRWWVDKDLPVPPPTERLDHPAFQPWRHRYLRFLHKTLTDDWGYIQGGGGTETLEKWIRVFEVLELGRQAQRDILDLAQQALAGRIMANAIMWHLCADMAVLPLYGDLSRWCSERAMRARMRIEMPPRENEGIHWTWSAGWGSYRVPEDCLRFSPLCVPRFGWTVVMGPGDAPLEPPECWGPPTAVFQ